MKCSGAVVLVFICVIVYSKTFVDGFISPDNKHQAKMPGGGKEKGFGQKRAPAESAAGATGPRDADKVDSETQGGTGNRQLLLQFKCNRCEGVSQFKISKNAYEEGIVICTCRTCDVRHLIADNLNKLDFPEFGRNIEEFMERQGTSNEITKAHAPELTPEVLARYDLAAGDDGTFTLSPKAVDRGTSS